VTVHVAAILTPASLCLYCLLASLSRDLRAGRLRGNVTFHVAAILTTALLCLCCFPLPLSRDLRAGRPRGNVIVHVAAILTTASLCLCCLFVPLSRKWDRDLYLNFRLTFYFALALSIVFQFGRWLPEDIRDRARAPHPNFPPYFLFTMDPLGFLP